MTVFGNFLPRHICQKGHILFAMMRNSWLALRVALRSSWFSGAPYDVYICDQVSVCLPVLRLLAPRSKLLFYCHYPDQLLAARASCVKRVYRLPFDVVEEVTTAVADRVLVNSIFTQRVYDRTFRLGLVRRATVLYPCVRLEGFMDVPEIDVKAGGELVFLSINRFERKKGIDLAVRALMVLRQRVPTDVFARVRLVLAGGYDERVLENKEYFEEISPVVRRGGLEDKIEYKRSFSDAEKFQLLERCIAVGYTPENEHFGIVPIEAMASARPVVAVRSGGPRESVVDAVTGYLSEPRAEDFAEAMAELAKNPGKARQMGRRGRARVREKFSRQTFGTHLHRHVGELAMSGASVASFAAVLLAVVFFIVAAVHVFRFGGIRGSLGVLFGSTTRERSRAGAGLDAPGADDEPWWV